MPIKFNCPKCGKQVGVPESAAGKTGKCSGCGTAISVPLPSPSTPSPRPTSQSATGYTFHLSDEDRTRIEEEERFRAEAKVRAEAAALENARPKGPMATTTCSVCRRVLEFDRTLTPSTFECPGCGAQVSLGKTDAVVPTGGIQTDEEPRGKVLTELTSKRLKLYLLSSGLLCCLGLFIMVTGIASERGPSQISLGPQFALGVVISGLGAAWNLWIRFTIWWEHG